MTGTDPMAAPAPARRRALLVDDHLDFRSTLAELLRVLGVEVALAAPGEHALQVAASFRPDVVLLDIRPPGLDAYRVARALRAQPATAGAMIVAVSVVDEADLRPGAAAAGIDLYLAKPVDLVRLRQAVGI